VSSTAFLQLHHTTIGQVSTCRHCDGGLAGDALDVIQAYTAQHPSNSLAKYIPALKLLVLDNSDSTSLLAGYCKAWMNEAKQPAFQASSTVLGALTLFVLLVV